MYDTLCVSDATGLIGVKEVLHPILGKKKSVKERPCSHGLKKSQIS